MAGSLLIVVEFAARESHGDSLATILVVRSREIWPVGVRRFEEATLREQELIAEVLLVIHG